MLGSSSVISLNQVDSVFLIEPLRTYRRLLEAKLRKILPSEISLCSYPTLENLGKGASNWRNSEAHVIVLSPQESQKFLRFPPSYADNARTFLMGVEMFTPNMVGIPLPERLQKEVLGKPGTALERREHAQDRAEVVAKYLSEYIRLCP